jgi:hypothetical protein
MDPKPQQQVKLFFRNGMVEEGIVISWGDKKSVLKSISSENLLVIQKTAEDIIAIKIFVEEAPQETVVPVYVDRPLEVKEREPLLRAKKLVELRGILAQEERERARQLMTTFKPGSVSLERYGNPIRLQKPPSFDSGKKD